MSYFRTSLLLISACSTLTAAPYWVDLFNGKNLDGWVQRGGVAKYTVEDGVIVGTSTLNTPTPRWWYFEFPLTLLAPVSDTEPNGPRA